jgi:hypothetical protein
MTGRQGNDKRDQPVPAPVSIAQYLDATGIRKSLQRMKYILHIGINKTGSKALQAFLGSSRQELQKIGICYPKLGRYWADHRDLAQAIKEGDFARFAIDPKAIADLARRPGDVVLLSSEDFHAIQNVADVAVHFPPETTKVVLYLREHVSYMRSWYQHAVKLRNITCSIAEYAQINARNFADLVRRWRAVYADNLVVRTYNRPELAGGDIAVDFFSAAFGARPPAARKVEDRNPGISGNLLFLKLVLNHFLSAEENQRCRDDWDRVSSLDERFSGRIFVSEDDVKRIARVHRADRAALHEEFGINFRPPPGALAGNAIPDLPRLQDDITRISDHAKSQGFALYEILESKRRLFLPSTAN